MFKRVVQLLLIAVLMAPAINANAEGESNKSGFVGVGARFAWNNYKTPVLAYTHDPGQTMEAYGGPNLAGEFHWGVVRQLVLSLALDFGYFQHLVFPFPESSDNIESGKATFFTFGALIGAKYYLWMPKSGKAVLTLHLGVGKYFTTVDNGDQMPGEDDATYNEFQRQKSVIKDLASPIVLQFAVGAEFFATDSFSIGADILGIRFAFSSSDEGQAAGAWTGEQKLVSLYVYSAITLNFNLASTGGGKRKAKVEEEADWGTGGWAPDETKSDGWGESAAQQPPPPAPQAQPQPQPQTQPGQTPQPGYQQQPSPPPAGGSGGWSSTTPPPPPPPPPAPEPLPAPKKKRKAVKPRKAAPADQPPPPPPGY